MKLHVKEKRKIYPQISHTSTVDVKKIWAIGRENTALLINIQSLKRRTNDLLSREKDSEEIFFSFYLFYAHFVRNNTNEKIALSKCSHLSCSHTCRLDPKKLLNHQLGYQY